MARRHPITMRLPDHSAWEELKRQLKLSDDQSTVLTETLHLALSHCEEMSEQLTRSEMHRALKKIDRLLDKLEIELNRADAVAALTELETYGAMALVISPSAATELPEYEERGVPVQALASLLATKEGQEKEILPSELDEISFTDRQRDLNTRTPELMQLLVRQLRRPVSSELSLHKPEKGGNRPRTDREILIFLLARDAPKLIGKKVVRSSNRKFKDLCTWVLNACQVDTEGLEDAIKRCLEKYSAWLKWHSLPKPGSSQGQPNDAS